MNVAKVSLCVMHSLSFCFCSIEFGREMANLAKLANALIDVIVVLHVDTESLKGEYEKEVKVEDCNQSLSSAQEAGIKFIRSVHGFFSAVNICDDKVKVRHITESIRHGDFRPAQQYFEGYRDHLHKCKCSHCEFKEKLTQAHKQCEKTKKECERKEKEASQKKKWGLGASIVSGVVAGAVAIFSGGLAIPFVAIAGYSAYLSYVNRELEKKFKKLYENVESTKEISDKVDLTLHEIDTIVQVKIRSAYENAKTEISLFDKLLITVKHCSEQVQEQEERLGRLLASNLTKHA